MFSNREPSRTSWTLEPRSPDGAVHMRWTGDVVTTASGVIAFSSPPGTPVEHFRRGIRYRLDHWCVAVFPDDSYNVMADFDRDGYPLRTYVNLATAAASADSCISWGDLWVDVIFTPDGKVAIVDEDELWDACHAGRVTRARATEVVALAGRIAQSRLPLFHPTELSAYVELLAKFEPAQL